MAKLSSYARNKDRLTEGERIMVGATGEQFGITTRGFTPAYRDTFHALKSEAARRLNRGAAPGAHIYTPDTLPPSEEDKCQGQALSRECVLGVDGLERDGGGDVTFDDFRQMLESGDYPALTFLALSAAGRVGDDRRRENEDAVGN